MCSSSRYHRIIILSVRITPKTHMLFRAACERCRYFIGWWKIGVQSLRIEHTVIILGITYVRSGPRNVRAQISTTVPRSVVVGDARNHQRCQFIPARNIELSVFANACCVRLRFGPRAVSPKGAPFCNLCVVIACKRRNIMQGHDTKITVAADLSRNVAGDTRAVQVQGNQILAVHDTRVDLTIELWIIRDRKNFNGASVKLGDDVARIRQHHDQNRDRRR